MEGIILESIIYSKLAGLYLTSSHSRLVAEGKKTLIVKTVAFQQHLQVPIYLISKEEDDEEDEATVWAKIVLAKPELISTAEFWRREDKHKITREEALRWWGDLSKKHLYAYRFQLLESYLEKPYHCVYEKGMQGWLASVNFIDKAPSEIAVQRLIEDPQDYDASKPRDDQLRDDYRITCSWYSTLKRGGSIKFDEDTIVALGEKILKELLHRKRENPSVFTAQPDEMKEHSKELYERITEKWSNEDKAFLETKREEVREAQHSRAKCMSCSKPPTIEILWAEGMAHAWFCDKHYEKWKAESDLHEVSSKRELKWGVASKWWRDGSPTKAEAQEYLEEDVREALLDEDEIKEIVPRLLLDMSDEQILKLLDRLHEAFAKTDINRELIVNATIFARNAALARWLEVPDYKDELDIQVAKIAGHTRLLRHDGTIERSQEEWTLEKVKSVLVPMVVIHQGLSQVGSSVYGLKQPHDLDFLVRLPEVHWNLLRTLQEIFPDKTVHITPEEKGPNWDYVALGDFVLVPEGWEMGRLWRGSESGEDLPEECLETIALITPVRLQERFLTLADDTLWLNSTISNPGLVLKLIRLLPGLEIESNTEAYKNPVALADLWFIPYPIIGKTMVSEPEFKKYYGEKPEEERKSEDLALLSLPASVTITEIKAPPVKGKITKITFGEWFPPVKTATGYAPVESIDPEANWKFWTEPMLREHKRVLCQIKFDGLRFVYHISVKDKGVKIFTEGNYAKKQAGLERSEYLPDLVEDALKSFDCRDCIVDSVPAHSPVVVRNQATKSIDILPISDLAQFNSNSLERVAVSSLEIYRGGNRWVPIKHILRHPYLGKLLRFATTSALLEVSPNHSLFRGTAKFPVDASAILVGDRLTMPLKYRQSGKEKENWKGAVFHGDEDLAWAYGFFVAEGSSSIQPRVKHYGIKLSNLSEELVERFASTFENHFSGIRFTRGIDTGGLFYCALSDKGLALFLKEKFYTLDNRKRVPKDILNAPKNIQRAFLEGYFAGDGSHTGYGWTFTTNSQVLAQGIIWLHQELCQQSWSVHFRKRQGSKLKAIESISVVFNQNDWHRNPAGKVKRIEDFNYSGYLYDIETEDHRFTCGVGSVLVHNTETVLYEKGIPLPRHRMAGLASGKEVITGKDIRVMCFDLLRLNGEDWSQKPYEERLAKLKKILDPKSKHYKFVKSIIIKNKEDFDKAMKELSRIVGSEGMMLKTPEMPGFSSTGTTSQMSKLKHLFEIDVVIIGRRKVPAAKPTGKKMTAEAMMGLLPSLKKKSDTWTFRCAFKGPDGKLWPLYSDKTYAPGDLTIKWDEERQVWKGTEDPKEWETLKEFPKAEAGAQCFGNTYNFKPEEGQEPKLGSVLTVAPVLMRCWKADDSVMLSWTFPRPRVLHPEETEPMDWKIVNNILKAVAARHGREAEVLIEKDMKRPPLEKPAEVKEALRPPITSPMGKYYMREKLVELIPEHKIYIESYVGAGSLLFAKPKSEKEVISDIHPDVYFAWKTIRNIDQEMADYIKGKSWKCNKEKFHRTKDWQPISKRDKLYRILFLMKHSFNADMYTFAELPEEKQKYPTWLDRWQEYTERLEGITILNQDGIKVIKEYDSPDAYFYLDPPYPFGAVRGFMSAKTWKISTFNEDGLKRLLETLQHIKGKFLLSLANDEKTRAAVRGYGFQLSRIRTRKTSGGIYEAGEYSTPSGHRTELLVSNYDIHKVKVKEVEKKKPLTHEEEREFAEALLGNPFMFKSQGKFASFAIQRHCRGIWYEEDRRGLLKEFRALKSEEELNKLWKDNDCEYLVKPIKAWQRELQEADDARRDITKVVSKYLTSDPPSLNELDLSKIVNRGNAHSDVRMKHPAEDHLVGITSTSPRLVIQFLETGELIFPLRDKIMENKLYDKIPATRKARQPLPWLTIVTKDKPILEVEKGEVGATLETAGRITFLASGDWIIGVSKDDYVELFLLFDKPYQRLSGRWGLQKLAGAPEYEKVPAEWWMLNKAALTPQGYLLTHPNREAVEAKAKKENIKQMVYNVQSIRSLLKDQRSKDWFKDIPEEKIEKVLKLYSEKAGEWKAK